jgi:putative cardiolipin synthase
MPLPRAVTTSFSVAPSRACAFARRAAAALAMVAVIGGCISIDPADIQRTPSTAYPTPAATPLGKLAYADASKHAGQSAFRLLESGRAGLSARIALIDAAQQSVDLQYYIMDGETAELVARRLLDAADRGVRVRLLLDDHGKHSDETALTALSSHPKIAVRLFNPVMMRGPAFALAAFEYVVRGSQLNRRMHNKAFIVDNAIAIVGGRNIGDAYFDAPGPIVFQDLDIIAAGPIVRSLSASFDEYWNSEYAVPIEALAKNAASADDVAKARQKVVAIGGSERAEMRIQPAAMSIISREIADGRLSMTWAQARVLADSPRKVEPQRGDSARQIADELVPALAAVKRDLVIVSPYVIPDDASMAAIRAARARGARVRALTNSLATSDLTIAHSGYAPWRTTLLDAGVELFEMKPQAVPFAGKSSGSGSGSGGSGGGSGSGSSHSTLHAKVIVLDRRFVFLSSMNLDPRSIRLNTEMGLWIDSPQLAGEIVQRFDDATKPENSYHVVRNTDSKLEWISASGGVAQRYDDEPDTTAEKRIRARLAQLLPLQDQL